jgi:hypothetical protein
MKTTGKKAIGLNITGGVMRRDFSEKADGSQRIVFFKSSVRCTTRRCDPSRPGGVKQLASDSRFGTRRFLYTRMHWHACARIYDVIVSICSVCACMCMYVDVYLQTSS